MPQTEFVIAPPPSPFLRVKGTDAVFPLHRIYCVGRNYAAHAIEMGGDPDREPPFFFQKNPDNLVIDDGDFPYPDRSNDVHHEIEMVVALSRGGRDIPVDRALSCVFGYGVGLDMTRRDLQAECKMHILRPLRNTSPTHMASRFQRGRAIKIENSIVRGSPLNWPGSGPSLFLKVQPLFVRAIYSSAKTH